MLDGHVLRSGDRAGLEQEMWALLTLYQLLRMAMVDAVETRPGPDPDRASFTTALQTARDQLIAAAGIAPSIDPGSDGHASSTVLLGSSAGPCWPRCCPPGGPATAPATVKCATSRYLNRDDGRPDPLDHASPRSTSWCAPRRSTRRR